MKHSLLSALASSLFLGASLHAQIPTPKPLMRDFMGINGHLDFKPELYNQTCAWARNYHPMVWDLMDDTSNTPKFPMSRQPIHDGPVDWQKVYGSWKKAGFSVDACLQFDPIHIEKWKDVKEDAFEYGKAFAKYFGPSGSQKLVESVEIGNEPAETGDKDFQTIFENMAKGLRAGDPKLKIMGACSGVKPDKYSKDVANFKGFENLYDVLNIHTYSMAEPWPTWRRSYPEDPNIPYLKVIEDMTKWRDAHARGKEIWVTEFGYDASTQKPDPSGPMAKWVSSTETEQAQWIVRSFLVFSSMDVQKAFVYFYNDKDEPSFHASSGITRNFVPKPAFWAMAHLYKTLGDYKFSRALTQTAGDAYVFEYVNPKLPKEPILVAWLPTGTQAESSKMLSLGGGQIVKAERMPLKEGPAETVALKANGNSVSAPLSESPLYIWLKRP